MEHSNRSHPALFSRFVGTLVVGVALVSLGWWVAGRIALAGDRVAVRNLESASVSLPVDSTRGLRILSWNIAHGRGDAPTGILRNWRGGGAEARIARLARIAEIIRSVDPDIVVLNEVDFDAHWSNGLDQAEILARTLGFPAWVEQINYDVRLPFGRLSFGNAVLSRVPIRDAEWLPIPPHRSIEALVAGAKGASVLRLATAAGELALVPVHLEVRGSDTRRSVVPRFDSLRAAEPAPVILAGDFNSSPEGWAGAEPGSAVEMLLDLGWNSPRVDAGPGGSGDTFLDERPSRAIDWILSEPPVRTVNVRVLDTGPDLSDHRPVTGTLVFDPPGRMSRGDGEAEATEDAR